jgi:hypothetical protein
MTAPVAAEEPPIVASAVRPTVRAVPPAAVPAAATKPTSFPVEVIGPEKLRQSRELNFTWDTVPGASAYEFTLFEEAASGRRRILSTGPQKENSVTLNAASVGRGNFIWQAEALVGNRRSSMGEKRFTIEAPLPSEPVPHDAGVLYGISE